jgi:hypothetical protein
MIFSLTIDLVLSGHKTCTTRLRHYGDSLGTWDGKPAVFFSRGETKTRWVVGRTYAVQFERCHPARGRFRLDRIEPVSDPVNVSLEIARAEGFATVEQYQAVWHSLHKTNPIQPCWRLWYTLLSRPKDYTPIPSPNSSSNAVQTAHDAGLAPAPGEPKSSAPQGTEARLENNRPQATPRGACASARSPDRS